MKSIDEQNDEIRARVNAELPRHAGGFETFEEMKAWLDAQNQRFLELCAESVDETAHTPGPWAACGCTIYAGETRISQTWDIDDEGLPTPEMEANARLISSAPELSEALEWALAQLEPSMDPDWQAAYKAATEALKLAKGGAK